MKRLILDAYNLLQKMLRRGDDYKEISGIILQLERYMGDVKKHLILYPKYNEKNAIVDDFIDLEDFYFDN